MKYFRVILFSVLFISCSQEIKNEGNEQEIDNTTYYAKELFNSGFLDFSDTTNIDSLKIRLLNSFYIYDEESNKIVHIAAEALAEFNFDFFLPKLKKMLKKRGYELDISTANGYESTHDIYVNGRKLKLYTKEELDNGTFWESAPRNLFRMLNQQLNNSRIEESFYLLYSGNDLHVLLLTQNQYKIIVDNYKNEVREIPYLP